MKIWEFALSSWGEQNYFSNAHIFSVDLKLFFNVFSFCTPNQFSNVEGERKFILLILRAMYVFFLHNRIIIDKKVK